MSVVGAGRGACGLIPLIALVLVQAASAQGVVRGFVTDAASGIPLPGTNVALHRLGDPEAVLRGAVTDGQGFYEVSGLQVGTYVARATFVGYTPRVDTLDVRGVETWSVALDPDSEALDEVVVQAEGGAADVRGGLQRIRPADVARIPAPDVSGDLASYLQSLPGVVAIGDRGGGLYVRGGTTSQNLVLVDGAPIYQPFHVVGFFSAFPEDLVSSVDFYAGGYPARYTGRVSSVLDIDIREGNYERVRAEGTVGPFLVSARGEGPIRKGESSWLASVRGSVVETVAEALVGEDLPLRFADALVKVSTASEGMRCSATAVGTYDRGIIDPERADAFTWQNGVLGGRCVFAPAEQSGRIDVTASLSHLQSAVGADRGFLRDEGRERESRLTEGRFSADLQRPLGPVRVRYGVQASLYVTDYRLGEQYTGVRENNDFVLGGALHAEVEVPLGGGLTVSPSAALVLKPFAFGFGVEPRVRATWQPAGEDGPEVSAAGGLYRQSLLGLVDERDAGSPFIAWTGPPNEAAETSATHALLGVTVPVGGGLRLGAEGYARHSERLLVPRWSPLAQFTTTLIEAGARSVGADVRVEWGRGPLYLYAAYAWGRTEYEASQDNFGVWFGEPLQRYSPPHDRRHQVQTAAQLDLGRTEVAVRWQYGSGLPYTRPYGFDVVIPPFGLPEPTTDPGVRRVVFERPFNGRLPTFHRLDVSVGHTFRLESGAELEVQGGAINAYDRDNIFYYDVFRSLRVDQLPLIPYVALRLGSR